MFNDIPEPEQLNAEESLTCLRVALVYLGRAAERASVALTDLLRLAETWEDELSRRPPV